MLAARNIALIVMAGTLGGCMESPAFLKKPTDAPVEVASRDSNFVQSGEEQHSEIIATLLARKSLLIPATPLNEVATAALNASARVAEAELRSAKLCAEAKSKNWLPTIGPNISLSSLGDLVAGILIEQVLFDNGHRKAERAFAAADVEVAAVNLSIDMNERVHSALSLYLYGLRADEKARLNARAMTRMREFERIVIGRVEGGVSDRADRRVVEGKIRDVNSAAASALEAASTARAELKAMTGRSFDAPEGVLELATIHERFVALSVLRAQAEASRTVAQATMERAGALPSLTASASVTGSGTNGGLNLGTDQGIGFGTPAQLRAIEASKETATRRIAQEQETADRNYTRLMQRLASFRRQETEAADLARASRETFTLFERQFDAGQRTVMDVINIYEQLVKREQAHIDAKYEVVLIQFELARDRGLLANGGSI